MILVKHFVTVQVFVGLDLVLTQQLENQREEILLSVHGLHRIIQGCVGLLRQIDLAVDDTHPARIADLLRQAFVHLLGPYRQIGQTGVLLICPFASTGTRSLPGSLLCRWRRLFLCLHRHGCQQCDGNRCDII